MMTNYSRINLNNILTYNLLSGAYNLALFIKAMQANPRVDMQSDSLTRASFHVYNDLLFHRRVFIEQCADGDSSAPDNAKRISGFLIFYDKRAENEAGSGRKLRIALLPHYGNDNLGLLSLLTNSDEKLLTGVVDYDILPRSVRKNIENPPLKFNESPFDRDRAEQDHLVSVLASKFGKNRSEFVRQAKDKIREEHGLVAVEMEGDDASMSKTIQFLRDNGFASKTSSEALSTSMQSLLNHRVGGIGDLEKKLKGLFMDAGNRGMAAQR